MAFDAGTIVARLELDEQDFNRKMDAAERREQEFAKRSAKSTIKLGVAPQEASQLRRQMEQLDRQLTQDAVRRSNSGQGSVLATLLGMSSPSAARAQASQQAQAQRSLLSRLESFVPGGGGGGGGRITIGGGGGGGNQGLGTGLFKGIGPGILGLGLRSSLIAGAGGIGLGALPGLVGGLAPLGLLAPAAGIVSSLGGAAISPATQLAQQQAQAQKALAAATTPAQRKAAQQQLASVQQQLGQQPAAIRQIYGSITSLEKRWQSFTASLAPAMVGPLHLISRVFGQLEQPIRQVFTGALTFARPVILGLRDLATGVLPLLGQAFRAASPLIRPLIDGLGKLLTGILPGLITLLHAAAPAVHAVAGIFAQLGSGIGTMLKDFAPVIRSSSIILSALGKVLAGLFPIVGQLAGVMARTLAPVFSQLAGVIRALEPVLLIVGRVFASLAKAILGDLVAAFSAFAHLLIDIRPALTVLASALSRVFTVLENSGVFAILGNALEKLVPILAKVINQVVKALAPALPPLISAAGTLAGVLATGLATALADLLIAITPVLVIAAKMITALVLWLQHTHLLIPVLGALTAAWLLFSGALTVTPIGLIITAIGLLVIAVVELVKHWSTVWHAIKSAAQDAWNFLTHGWGQVLVPGLTAIRLAVEFVRDHWHQAWTDMTGWAQDAWHAVDNDVIHPVEQVFTQSIPNWVDAGKNAWHQAFTDMHNWAVDAWHAIYNDVWSPVDRVFTSDLENWLNNAKNAWDSFWNRVQSLAVGAWHAIYNNVWVPFRNVITNSVGSWFRDGVNAISRAWNDVKGVVTAPVRFVVDHVLDGLISAFDWISGKVGGPHINPVHPFGLAQGGRIYQGTNELADDVLVRVSKGETVLSGAHSRALAPILAAVGVPGYASGGRVGQNPPQSIHVGTTAHPTGNPLSGFWHKLVDVGKITAAVFTGNTKALTNAFYDMLPNGVGGAVGDMAKLLFAIPRTLIKDAVRTLIDAGGLGANAGAIVKWAEQWIGKIPYVWGGTAVPGGADCSGFTQAVYQHFGIPAPRTSEEQGSWVRRGPPTPGGLAFYHSPPGGPDPGHVAIVRTVRGNAGTVISQGGGMGPQVESLNFLPLLWTGVPPGGLGSGGTTRGTMSKMAVENVWRQAGGPGGFTADIAQAITGAESGRRPGIVQGGVAPGVTGYGLWQITPTSGISQGGRFGNLLNALNNARAAVSLYRGAGGRFTPWVTYNDGAYARFLDTGGWLHPGTTMAHNATGAREAVLTPSQSSAFVAMAEALRQAQSSGRGNLGIEAKLERIHQAIKASSAATGSAVGDAINGATRSAFYRASYNARGV